jgi:quinol-cytochrome oxidoreductase complex cytochrome b subunit|tara:strand:+ start:79 stop:339 length:261 start_codon:yes stop_codon:yes gene_type:complete
MSTAYTLLLGLVVFLVLFIYFVFFSISLRLEKDQNEAQIAVKRKSVPFKWKDLVDSKNKKLGFIDLGNHILIAGIVLFGIFIITNS